MNIITSNFTFSFGPTTCLCSQMIKTDKDKRHITEEHVLHVSNDYNIIQRK